MEVAMEVAVLSSHAISTAALLHIGQVDGPAVMSASSRILILVIVLSLCWCWCDVDAVGDVSVDQPEVVFELVASGDRGLFGRECLGGRVDHAGRERKESGG